MDFLIAGGSGFIGTALTRSLSEKGHQVWILTRKASPVTGRSQAHFLQWDGKSVQEWGKKVNEVDAVINLSGESLSHWPWTEARKRQFLESRTLPTRALVQAIRQAERKPRLYLQASGINHYGLRGEPADENTPPGNDFLARLTVEWENASQPLEELGIRRIITRLAVVLDWHGGMLQLMALPVRLFLGGPIGNGRQAVPWIHLQDVIAAMEFLLFNESARGIYNLIAPQATSNADFMRTLAHVLHRPYWFPTPAFLLRLVLGEMSVLITEGRYARPHRLLEAGYTFRYPALEDALMAR
ncbi:MAG: TIGR01777 family oxidoreductase [Anaerolineales bacterium]